MPYLFLYENVKTGKNVKTDKKLIWPDFFNRFVEKRMLVLFFHFRGFPRLQYPNLMSDLSYNHVML